MKRRHVRRLRAGVPGSFVPTIVLLLASGVAEAQESLQLSSDVRAAVIKSALEGLRQRAPAVPTRFVPLRVALTEAEKVDGRAGPKLVASVIVVDYSSSVGWAVAVAPDTSKVLDVTRLPGRPQSSPAERTRAETIVAGDPQVARLLAQNGYVIGGFVVDSPEGAGKGGRFLEYHVGSADHRSILLEVIVDLAAEKVVARRESAQPTGKK